MKFGLPRSFVFYTNIKITPPESGPTTSSSSSISLVDSSTSDESFFRQKYRQAKNFVGDTAFGLTRDYGVKPALAVTTTCAKLAVRPVQYLDNKLLGDQVQTNLLDPTAEKVKRVVSNMGPRNSQGRRMGEDVAETCGSVFERPLRGANAQLTEEYRANNKRSAAQSSAVVPGQEDASESQDTQPCDAVPLPHADGDGGSSSASADSENNNKESPHKDGSLPPSTEDGAGAPVQYAAPPKGCGVVPLYVQSSTSARRAVRATQSACTASGGAASTDPEDSDSPAHSTRRQDEEASSPPTGPTDPLSSTKNSTLHLQITSQTVHTEMENPPNNASNSQSASRPELVPENMSDGHASSMGRQLPKDETSGTARGESGRPSSKNGALSQSTSVTPRPALPQQATTTLTTATPRITAAGGPGGPPPGTTSTPSMANNAGGKDPTSKNPPIDPILPSLGALGLGVILCAVFLWYFFYRQKTHHVVRRGRSTADSFLE